LRKSAYQKPSSTAQISGPKADHEANVYDVKANFIRGD
jgi:hypothetical protein